MELLSKNNSMIIFLFLIIIILILFIKIKIKINISIVNTIIKLKLDVLFFHIQKKGKFRIKHKNNFVMKKKKSKRIRNWFCDVYWCCDFDG